MALIPWPEEEPEEPEEPYDFDGETFEPDRDAIRLTKQWKDIWEFMRDEEWHTLPEISRETGHPEASISARLRDFRKKRFGYHEVEKQYLFEGLWMYRLHINREVVMATEE